MMSKNQQRNYVRAESCFDKMRRAAIKAVGMSGANINSRPTMRPTTPKVTRRLKDRESRI